MYVLNKAFGGLSEKKAPRGGGTFFPDTPHHRSYKAYITHTHKREREEDTTRRPFNTPALVWFVLSLFWHWQNLD